MELQKPGAGLPNKERLFIKNILVPTARTLFTWNLALYILKREVKIISKLVDSTPKNLLQHKMIIDRTFAIEDDSRQFSINMVVEHLTITGNAIMLVINTLSKEKEFSRDVTVEGVKPFENKEDAIVDLLAFTDTYENFINSLDKKPSKQTKAHPWFIEFNNFDWSIFNAIHTFIHRRHIEAIISKLKKENLL